MKIRTVMCTHTLVDAAIMLYFYFHTCFTHFINRKKPVYINNIILISANRCKGSNCT